MCGRFASSLPPEEMRRLFATLGEITNHPPSWNVAPTQTALVVRRHPGTGERHLDPLVWGLIPSFEKDPKGGRKPINARSETLATAGMFRSAFKARRCLVPMDAFYEWDTTPTGKQPYAFARRDGVPLALAGLWEGWRSPDGEIRRTFTIATTTANRFMARIHDRMPVILEVADWPAWLGETETDPSALLRPAAEDVLRSWPVSRDVNSPRHDRADLLDRVDLPDKSRDDAEAGPDTA
jgi:putative SOS response-associated peptidase YedK